MRWFGWLRKQQEMAVSSAVLCDDLPDNGAPQQDDFFIGETMRVPLEFCRWLHDNFDELIHEHRGELIAQAHQDASAEKAMGTPEERKHKVFSAKANGAAQ